MSPQQSLILASESQQVPGWTPTFERRRACQAEPARSLMAETDRRMLLPARRIGCDLQPIGVSRLPAGRINETVYTENGPWKVIDYRDDPARQQYDGDMPIPVRLVPWLQELDRAQVRPQFLVFAHQQSPDWKEGDPLAPVPTPRHLREKDERLTQRLDFGSKLLLGTLGGLLAIAAAPLALGAAAGTGLDPILFGGVRHPELPLVEWVYICEWEWQ